MMGEVDPVELTAELVRRPSLTPDEAGCFDLLQGALEPLGFTVQRLRFASEGATPVPNLFATVGGRRGRIWDGAVTSTSYPRAISLAGRSIRSAAKGGKGSCTVAAAST